MSGTPGSSGFSSSCGPIHVLVPDFLATAPHYCLSVALSMCKEGFMCWYWANHTIEAYPCYHYVFIYFAGLGIKSRSLQMIIKYLATELFPSPPQPARSTQNHCTFLSAIYNKQWQAKVTSTLKSHQPANQGHWILQVMSSKILSCEDQNLTNSLCFFLQNLPPLTEYGNAGC